MGKFMKKARGVGGVIEIPTQRQQGVRTRARAQAIEKIKELITSSSAHGGNGVLQNSTSARSFMPTQISYLELRSRRLEKTVGCHGNKSPSARKGNSADECRRLSDLTNSDILTEDSCSRLTHSAEGTRHTHRQTNYGACDENREILYHFNGDNEGEELSLHGCVRSLQQWGSRGRAPPSVAQSRSNSRSNSVTRELPPPAHEHQPRGILTRNQRKMEKQFCATITCTNKAANTDMELDLFCHANERPGSSSPDSCLVRNVNVEVSFGEKTLDEGWFAKDRHSGEGTPINHTREANSPFSVRLLPELAAHNKEAAPSNMVSPLDTEIEDFFFHAEQNEQRRFIEQYNFDPVTETPLPGRYDWVSL